MIQLVVTADDFGADVAVNEAVEAAHTGGILTAASLMVSGRAEADAVERARRLPRLGVGLHLVLVEGRPTLPAADIPDLVDGSGLFRTNMALAGLKFALSPNARRQLAAEIEAQFAAFAATGLTLDHVNAHKHFHVHPVIGAMVIDAARRYKAPALRAPVEPGRPRGTARLAVIFARMLRWKARAAGLAAPDRVFGLTSTGNMDAEHAIAAVAALGEGLNELYVHPAVRDDWPGHADGYRYRAEFEALIAPGGPHRASCVPGDARQLRRNDRTAAMKRALSVHGPRLAILCASLLGLAVAAWMLGEAGIGQVLGVVARLGIGGFLVYTGYSLLVVAAARRCLGERGAAACGSGQPIAVQLGAAGTGGGCRHPALLASGRADRGHSPAAGAAAVGAADLRVGRG